MKFLELFSSAKMDRIGADYQDVIQQIKDRLGAALAVPVQVMIGSEENFQGVVDLIKMEAIYWNTEDQGMTYKIWRKYQRK